MIANLVWLFQLTMFVGMAKAFIEMGQRVQSEYEESLGASDLEDLKKSRELALRDRQLAQFLHGSMQAKLNSVASRIEARGKTGSLEDYIHEIEGLLNAAVTEFSQQRVSSIEEIVLRLERDWSGLIQLSFAINPTPLTDQQLEIVREVMNEGIANAVRHGFASRVSIYLSADLELRIVDDGTGPREGPHGLGSTYFESISDDWELTDTGAGALLRVQLR
jgi:nitrate/nitrite-specific signal transduction histidine kinase